MRIIHPVARFAESISLALSSLVPFVGFLDRLWPWLEKVFSFRKESPRNKIIKSELERDVSAGKRTCRTTMVASV